MAVTQSEHAEGKACMCKVCECGMHKCPTMHVSSLVHYPSDLNSEYSRTYQAWPPQKRAATKRLNEISNTAPFVGVTTHKVDYCPKKIPERNPKHVGDTKTLDHCIPTGTYNNVSTEYSAHYWKKPVQSRMAPKNADRPKDGSRFDGTTTHKTDFQKWAIPARAPVKQAESAMTNSQAPFVDTTTYKVAYWDKSKGIVRAQRKHENKGVRSGKGTFYGETTHHADYGRKSIPKREPAVKHDATLGNTDAKFSGETTYHENYKAWEVRAARRGETLKSNLTSSGSKFSGESLYHTDFKAPKLPKRCPVLSKGRPQQLVGDHFVY